MKMNHTLQMTPQFKVLSDDQIEEIFYAALDVLERTGGMVYQEEALDLFKAALGEVACVATFQHAIHNPPAELEDFAIPAAPGLDRLAKLLRLAGAQNQGADPGELDPLEARNIPLLLHDAAVS